MEKTQNKYELKNCENFHLQIALLLYASIYKNFRHFTSNIFAIISRMCVYVNMSTSICTRNGKLSLNGKAFINYD